MAVASKGDGGSATPLLLPTIERDVHGAYFAITCGNISGQFYHAKFSHAKCKCVLVNKKWYSPSEVEALAGRKARKWRQSLMHLGKPLSAYDLSCSTSTLASVCGQSSTSPDGSLSDSTLCSGSIDLPAGGQTPAVNVVPSPHREELSSSGQTASAPCLVSPVLAFIKAFCLQGDVDTIKRSVCENFSSELVVGLRTLFRHNIGNNRLVIYGSIMQE